MIACVSSVAKSLKLPKATRWDERRYDGGVPASFPRIINKRDARASRLNKIKGSAS